MGLTRPRFSQFDTTISSISDPITVLNKSSTLANVDVGFIINRNSGALANTAIFWNESANTFALVFTTNSGEVPNANIAISEYANLKINALTADTAVFSSTGAIKIPSGNTLQRTSGTTGQIRFNTSTSQFEGYQGASWSSLGGVRSVDNATYIIAEQYPGAGNNILYFYTNNTLQATVSSTGINLAGNVLATTGTFNTLTVNGNESVTGYLNVTGNIIATTATIGTVEAAGMIYANSATNSTSTTTGALRVAGGIGVVGNIWADRIHAGNNGNGTNFKVGDDLWLGDINVANTMRLMGAQDNTQAFIRFGNTNTSTLGVSGSGPLSWGGVLNITGNILAANVNASYFIGSGTALTGINSFGNIFISGQSPVLADNTSDILTLVGGTGIAITTDAANDSIIFSSVSSSGPFATSGDFGAVNDPVTVSEDEGSVTDSATITYDLGSIISATGLMYPDQLVLPSYPTASLPTASVSAQLVFDSDSTSLKYSDGANWQLVGSYSNVQVASYLTVNPPAGYSNVQVASYLTVNPPAGTYSNTQVASYLTVNPPAGTYSNVQVASYLPSYNGNIYARSIGVGTDSFGNVGEIRATNYITSFYSDRRLKTDIVPITNALNKVTQLSGVIYTQNKLAETFGYTDYSRQVGVLAQEVQLVQPEAVKPAPFDIASDGSSISGEDYLTVQYEKLIPLLIEAIKELQSEVDGLKQQIGNANGSNTNRH